MTETIFWGMWVPINLKIKCIRESLNFINLTYRMVPDMLCLEGSLELR